VSGGGGGDDTAWDGRRQRGLPHNIRNGISLSGRNQAEMREARDLPLIGYSWVGV